MLLLPIRFEAIRRLPTIAIPRASGIGCVVPTLSQLTSYTNHVTHGIKEFTNHNKTTSFPVLDSSNPPNYKPSIASHEPILRYPLLTFPS